MVLIPPPSESTSSEIYGACLLRLLPYFGLLFLELYLVITLASTGISPCDVKVHTLDRLLHLNAGEETPRATECKRM